MCLDHLHTGKVNHTLSACALRVMSESHNEGSWDGVIFHRRQPLSLTSRYDVFESGRVHCAVIFFIMSAKSFAHLHISPNLIVRSLCRPFRAHSFFLVSCLGLRSLHSLDLGWHI
jgi:hypothetical protein